MFALFGCQFAVQLLLGRAGAGLVGVAGEKRCGALLQRDRDAKQIGRVLRPVLDLGKDGSQFQPELLRRVGDLDVVTPG